MEVSNVQGIYHAGELAVQARAGVQGMAQWVAGAIGTTMKPVAQEFLNQQPMAFVASIDAERRVWASVVVGLPGFMEAIDEKTVRIHAAPTVGDPLHDNLVENPDFGLLIIEFATRRRMRINGQAAVQPDGSFLVHAQQVYANCPKYIQARRVEVSTPDEQNTSDVSRTDQLTAKQQRWIARSDTFFIASAHPLGGADASHRGGNPGFITLADAETLIWPDYVGNNMFNTLGNIVANPQAGLLFLDFDTGSTLQLTGEANIIWDIGQILEYKGAERLVSYRIEHVLEIKRALPLRWQFESYSPFNPG
jgi:predicted pyridoxine 5'-phosphate oxidase superfamily flavin-nucleotide-binding protein